MHAFTTERLLIRPLAAQDKMLYISLYTDAKIMRHIGKPLSKIAAEKAFNNTLKAMQKEKTKVMTWAIVTLDGKQCIGVQGLNRSSDNCAEIGILLSRSSSGKLFPEEAIGSLIEYSLKYLMLKQINACYAKNNLATARVAKKAGFTYFQSNQDQTNITESVYKKTWHRHYIKTVIGCE